MPLTPPVEPDVAGPLPGAGAPAAPAPALLEGPPVPVGVGIGSPPPAPPPAGPAPIPPSLDDAGALPVIAAGNVRQQEAEKVKGDVAQANADEMAADADRAAAQHDAEAEEIRQANERSARAMDEAHRQTVAALDEAKNKHIPAFWEGREGKRTEAAILVGIGAFGASLQGINQNQAADILKDSVDSHFRREKEKVDNLYKFAAAKGSDEDNLRQRHTQELAGLQAKYGATKLAIAARIDKQTALNLGRTDKAAAAAMSAKLIAEGQEQILRAKSTLAEIALRNANAQRATAKAKAASAGGGPGRGDALAAFAEAAGELEPGEPIPASLVKLGVAARLKPNQIAGEADKYRGSGSKATKLAEAAEKAGKPGIEVRDEKGTVVGYWPKEASRTWSKNQEDFRKFRVASDSIKRLLANEDFFKAVPKGGDWDNAVLGVAAVSNAGTTVPALEHEAGSMKDRAGLVDKNLLRTKLKEIEERYGYIKNQLIPLGKGGGDKIAQAKAWLADPKNASSPHRAGVEAKLKELSP